MEMPLSDWVQTQIDAASSMVGRSIIRWDAIEMTVQEDRDGGQPVFSHLSALCLQLLAAAIAVSEGPLPTTRTARDTETREPALTVPAAPSRCGRHLG